MNELFNTYRPEGFHTLNAYLFVDAPEALIDFLKVAFHAEEIEKTLDEQSNRIANCIIQLGDSCFMISQASERFKAMPSAFYFFVADVDAVFNNALDHGAVSIMPPMDMSYGDRQGGITDPAGNIWWITTRLVEKGYQE